MDPVWIIVIVGLGLTLIWAVAGHKRGDELQQAMAALEAGAPIRAEMKARRGLRFAERKRGVRSAEAAHARYVLAGAMVAAGDLEGAREEFTRARAIMSDAPPSAEARAQSGRFMLGLAIAALREDDRRGAGLALEQLGELLPEDDPVAALGARHQKAIKSRGPAPFKKIERRLGEAVTRVLAAALPADLLGPVAVRFGLSGALEMSVSTQREPDGAEQQAMAKAVAAAQATLDAELG